MSTSPPPSPLFSRSSSGSSSGHGYIPLGVPKVAKLLVKMRRHRSKAKAHHIESSSGPAPLTHPALRGDGAVSPQRVPLEENVTFVCRDGVDVAKLLRAARASLYQKAVEVGANVLVDEQWSCTICGPRHRSDGTFRVYVRYSACGARSDKRDPQRPVALENVRDVPGLMTIVSRLD
ncbi:hypothetical protein BD309DRAFT_874327 [Dichomitus squalens]|uniref:Uncharacterized protein n=2 Tax=Dichomitus squalens TaxID=114155 RepID=A0A4Q9PZY8_9APHY|nr:uncharacterized protein DICSQDRAFT_93860 [Dichomitus squalens LYAD-421 SS1]EJF56233.1 hypothetical protein DICSQDRAFT_93860 [Dichomitus squalens LYAD-421 SS1]TBU25594.1 hypothetical protein BD311DRAFT_764211 [Dichomitus squalens]TBU38459.1 hypothetical protein BD309DRAFT_874327 [Dichomitus squalens]TBU60427.1 hypothetical protein BD310DRAFT_332117 [Dichomitus squalens]